MFSITAVSFTAVMLLFLPSCTEKKENLAEAINEKDSLPTLTSRGVSTLISDSGIIRYKMVAEEWDIYTQTNPSKWVFIKGLYIEKFDLKLHVDASIQADTAYYYDQKRLWELRGRVFVRNQQGTTFRTEELFWDQAAKEIYSHQYIKVVTPDRELEGTEFRSNETMTKYTVSNSAGHFPMRDNPTEPDTLTTIP